MSIVELFTEAVGARPDRVAPLGDGWRSSAHRIDVGDESFVIRLTDKARFEERVWHLVHKTVSMPELIYTDDRCAITRFVEGGAPTVEASEAIGLTLAAIHAIPFEEPNDYCYFDETVRLLTSSERIKQRIGEENRVQALALVKRREELFPRSDEMAILVHSDFRADNLLWHSEHGLTVLDWEFAHRGSPLIDLGQLFREPLIDREAFIAAYGELPADWERRAVMTDMVNLAMLLDSPLDRPRFYARIIRCLEGTLLEFR